MLFDDLVITATEVALRTLYLICAHRAHVVANFVNPKRLKQRNEGFVIHPQLLGNHIHPKFAHRTSDNSLTLATVNDGCG